MFSRTVFNTRVIGAFSKAKGGFRAFSEDVVEKNAVGRKEVIEAIATETKLTKTDVEKFLKSFMNVITHEVLTNGKSVTFNKFGSFKLKELKARTGRNPSNGEALQIKGSKSITFSLANSLKVREN